MTPSINLLLTKTSQSASLFPPPCSTTSQLLFLFSLRPLHCTHPIIHNHLLNLPISPPFFLCSPSSSTFHVPSLLIALPGTCHGAAFALNLGPNPVLSSGLICHCSDISLLALDAASDTRGMPVGVDCCCGSLMTDTTLRFGER